MKMSHRTSFDLQKEYYEAEILHKELLAKYDLCKTSFENLLRGNFDDFIGTKEYQNILINYWNDIEDKTKAYCNVLELTEIKEKLESNSSELRLPIDDSPPDSKMRLKIATMKLKWLRYNLTKYEFALEHFEELIERVENKGKSKNKEKLVNDIKHYNQNEKSMIKHIERLSKEFKNDN